MLARTMLLALAVMLGGLSAALAEERVITVVGEGRVERDPDMATIRIGVVTEAAGAREAIDSNSRQMAGVMARLKDLGVSDRDLQTSAFSVAQRWDRSSSGAQRAAGFVTRNILTVRVRDLARLGEVLDAVARDGANSFDGLQFGLSDPRDAQDAARRAAIADARRKAELYAGAAGAAVGTVLTISETGAAPSPLPMMRAEMAVASDAVPVSPGELTLSARVTVAYSLVDGT